jgi:predicted DNA-binding protein (UPF0251 family)
LPKTNCFGPLDNAPYIESSVEMTVDEYESIRLIDYENLTQEECASQMNIGRTTVQSIYNEARNKLADSLVNGKVLCIKGGEYRLCDGHGNACRIGCRRHTQEI